MIDQRLVDLLVDGELSDEQERALIARLDEMPDGWRRCALAFLESRCWQRAAESMTQPCQGEPHAVAARRTAPDWRTRPWTWALVIAATFLLAFGVGTFLPSGGDRSGSRDLAQPDATALPPGAGLAQVGSPAGTPVTDPRGLAGDLYRGNLTLVNDAGSEIDVPVYDWNQQVAEELMYRSQPLPPDLVRQLKRHRVRSSRSIVPVQLKDGTRVVLPVHEVDITPVGGMPY